MARGLFDEPTEAELVEVMQEAIKPVKAMLKAVVADDELFALIAQLTKKTYDALVKEGMSAEVAAQVASSQASGMMKASK